MTEQKDEIALIRAIKKGDDQAFLHLCEQYRPLLQSTVKKFCKPPLFDEGEWEDLHQEAMLALFKAAQSYDEQVNGVTFGLYAKICINNRLISAVRHKKRKQEAQRESAEGEVRRVGRPRKKKIEEKKSRTVSGLPTDTQLERLLFLAQNDLSGLEREVFDLYLSGLRYKEIGKRLNCDIKAVDNALARAKKKIKKRVNEE
ncbi:MAG: sigma-70 family RNA polymerase sigma factor [Clostridia bacterium]|nr:sigma-70 family RNA polymerase sigma factor [Clostridia bacterium]